MADKHKSKSYDGIACQTKLLKKINQQYTFLVIFVTDCCDELHVKMQQLSRQQVLFPFVFCNM